MSALFGPRGTGKTSFISDLASELAVEQEADAPPWETLQVDLRRAISLPAFVGALTDAVDRHADAGLRRRALSAPGEVLHRQLRALGSLADRLVIVLDEFSGWRTAPVIR